MKNSTYLYRIAFVAALGGLLFGFDTAVISGVIPFIKESVENGKIVAIASQALRGHVNLNLYETARSAKKAGALSCKDMTIEASIIKMMFLLGIYENPEDVAGNFTNNIAGELTD